MSSALIFALFNGLSMGMAVFLVAAGLTLVFGILKVLNFAHGGFFMIGAYVAFTLLDPHSISIPAFLGAAIAAGIVVGVLGYFADLLIFRRLRNVDEAYTLIATFALLMVVNGSVKLIWGLNFHSVPPPDMLLGALQIGPVFIPIFSLAVIVLAIAIFLVLDLAIHRSWTGKIIQAVAHDSWMSAISGINVPAIFTGAVIAAFFFAGLAGALLLPNQALSPALAGSYLLQAFVVIIIGGLGNVRGAFLAALLLGLVESLNSVLMPSYPGVAIYLAMVFFLLWRPQGLFARRESGTVEMSPVGPPGPEARWQHSVPVHVRVILAVTAFASLASVPLWADQGFLFVCGLMLIQVMFALSWNLLFGFAGLAVFGHAAFFAIGAYFVGMLMKQSPETPFLLVLAGSALAGSAVAFAFGAIAVRRTTGIALAILTLAASEILRIFISRTAALGGDDGLPAIPRPVLDFGFAAISLVSSTAYYLFLCVACAVVGGALWWLTSSAFGRVLLCMRQDPLRTEFLGVRMGRYRVAAFTISGGVAALAGGLQAPWAQIVTTDVANYLNSTQPMLNALLGGVDFFWGPAVGAFLFTMLQYSLRMYPGLAELVTGAALLAVVLAAPAGVLGLLARFRSRATKREAGGAAESVEGARP
jgi:ABC-type branched-subunit amino acid transport system permease subunit